MQTALTQVTRFMQASYLERERDLPDQDGIRQRIRRIIAEKADGRQGVLAEMAGIQPGTLSKQVGGSNPVTKRNLYKIEQATGARLVWLEKGVEPIYHPGGKAPKAAKAVGEGQLLKEYLKRNKIKGTDLGEMIGRTKSTVSGYFSRTELDPDTHKMITDALNVSDEDIFGTTNGTTKLISGRTDNFPIRDYNPNQQDSVEIIRISVPARAGFEYDVYFSVESSEKETKGVRRDLIKPHFDLEKHYNEIALIEIDGDSMEPLLRPGYEVIGYLVDKADWPYLTQVVAVTFRDQFVVKRILENGLLMTGMLTLTSDNPSGGKLMVPVSEIHQIWKIDRITNGKL